MVPYWLSLVLRRILGAAIMAAKAAARAGAGYVTVATPDPCANLIRMALPSIPVVGIPADTRGAFGAAAGSAVRDLAENSTASFVAPV